MHHLQYQQHLMICFLEIQDTNNFIYRASAITFEVAAEIKRYGADMNVVKKYLKEEVGVISIDSIYTPIVRVQYDVDKTRVEDSADFDKLTIEVETNGSIDAKEA